MTDADEPSFPLLRASHPDGRTSLFMLTDHTYPWEKYPLDYKQYVRAQKTAAVEFLSIPEANLLEFTKKLLHPGSWPPAFFCETPDSWKIQDQERTNAFQRAYTRILKAIGVDEQAGYPLQLTKLKPGFVAFLLYALHDICDPLTQEGMDAGIEREFNTPNEGKRCIGLEDFFSSAHCHDIPNATYEDVRGDFSILPGIEDIAGLQDTVNRGPEVFEDFAGLLEAVTLGNQKAYQQGLKERDDARKTMGASPIASQQEESEAAAKVAESMGSEKKMGDTSLDFAKNFSQYYQEDLQNGEAKMASLCSILTLRGAISQRNKMWLPTILQLMERKDALIAVGGAHFLGKEGLMQLLREKGAVWEYFDLRSNFWKNLFEPTS